MQQAHNTSQLSNKPKTQINNTMQQVNNTTSQQQHSKSTTQQVNNATGRQCIKSTMQEKASSSCNNIKCSRQTGYDPHSGAKFNPEITAMSPLPVCHNAASFGSRQSSMLLLVGYCESKVRSRDDLQWLRIGSASGSNFPSWCINT